MRVSAKKVIFLPVNIELSKLASVLECNAQGIVFLVKKDKIVWDDIQSAI